MAAMLQHQDDGALRCSFFRALCRLPGGGISASVRSTAGARAPAVA